MIYEEARRLRRSLKRQREEWLATTQVIEHQPTKFSLHIGKGFRGLQPIPSDVQWWMDGDLIRYGFIERLIIWFGGARSIHREVQRQAAAYCPFVGKA
jgi:hypothetical protein